MNERAKRTEITQDRVLQELAAIGFSNTADFVRVTGNGIVKLTPTDGLSEEQQRAIASIKEGKYGVELRLHDKLSALQMLGQHLGMFHGKIKEESEDIEDDGLLAALGANAQALFDDGDDSGMLPKVKEE